MTDTKVIVSRDNSEALTELFRAVRESAEDQTWFVEALLRTAGLLRDPKIYPEPAGLRSFTLMHYEDKLRGEVRLEEDKIFIISLEQA